MDGSHRAVLATEKVYSISGIALDIPTKRVFWIDQSYDFMNTVTYDGHHRWVILMGVSGEGEGMDCDLGTEALGVFGK